MIGSVGVGTSPRSVASVVTCTTEGSVSANTACASVGGDARRAVGARYPRGGTASPSCARGPDSSSEGRGAKPVSGRRASSLGPAGSRREPEPPGGRSSLGGAPPPNQLGRTRTMSSSVSSRTVDSPRKTSSASRPAVAAGAADGLFGVDGGASMRAEAYGAPRPQLVSARQSRAIDAPSPAQRRYRPPRWDR